jgi:hypothetical protein
MMLRRSAVAVTAGVVLLVLPGILGSQSGNWLMRFTPTAAFAIQATLPYSNLVVSDYTPPNGYFPDQPLGRPRRARRLHRRGPGRSQVGAPPPGHLNADRPESITSVASSPHGHISATGEYNSRTHLRRVG